MTWLISRNLSNSPPFLLPCLQLTQHCQIHNFFTSFQYRPLHCMFVSQSSPYPSFQQQPTDCGKLISAFEELYSFAASFITPTAFQMLPKLVQWVNSLLRQIPISTNRSVDRARLIPRISMSHPQPTTFKQTARHRFATNSLREECFKRGIHTSGQIYRAKVHVDGQTCWEEVHLQRGSSKSMVWYRHTSSPMIGND